MFRKSSACKVNWYWSVGNHEPRQRFALRYANFKRKCFIDKVIRVKPLMFAKNVCEPTGATAWQNGCFFWNTTILVPKRSPKTVWRDVFSTFQDNNKRKHKTNFNNKSDKTHLLFFLDSSCYMFSVHVLMHSTYIHTYTCVCFCLSFFPCIYNCIYLFWNYFVVWSVCSLIFLSQCFLPVDLFFDSFSKNTWNLAIQSKIATLKPTNRLFCDAIVTDVAFFWPVTFQIVNGLWHHLPEAVAIVASATGRSNSTSPHSKEFFWIFCIDLLGKKMHKS